MEIQQDKVITIKLTMHEQQLITLALEQYVNSEPLGIPGMSAEGRRIVEKTHREMEQLFRKFREW